MAKKTKAQKRKKERKAVFHLEFREALRYWVEIDRRIALRAFDLVEAIMREPFTGIGKPEALKYLDPDTWSRRLKQEHRVVYLVSEDRIDFLQLVITTEQAPNILRSVVVRIVEPWLWST